MASARSSDPNQVAERSGGVHWKNGCAAPTRTVPASTCDGYGRDIAEIQVVSACDGSERSVLVVRMMERCGCAAQTDELLIATDGMRTSAYGGARDAAEISPRCTDG